MLRLSIPGKVAYDVGQPLSFFKSWFFVQSLLTINYNLLVSLFPVLIEGERGLSMEIYGGQTWWNISNFEWNLNVSYACFVFCFVF